MLCIVLWQYPQLSTLIVDSFDMNGTIETHHRTSPPGVVCLLTIFSNDIRGICKGDSFSFKLYTGRIHDQPVILLQGIGTQ